MGLQTDLTPREWEIAHLIAAGATNREIADELVVAHGTVAVHVHHILEKLGMRNRQDITRWVVERSQAANNRS